MTEIDNDAMKDEATELICAILDDRVTDAGWDRLSELITLNPQVCDYFLTQLSFHTKLQQVFARPESTADFPVSTATKAAPAAAFIIPRRKTRHHLMVWRSAALAAAILSVWVAVFHFSRPGEHLDSGLVQNSPPPVLQIASMEVVDQFGQRSTRWLTSGERVMLHDLVKNPPVEVNFINGIRMRLSVPSDVTLEDSMNCVLHRGKAYVTVPEGGAGFCIRAAETQIRDYGTEFGVSINDQNIAEVAVVKGEVGVLTERAAQETKLYTGQGVTIEAGVLKRLYLVTDASFPSSPLLSDRVPLIVNVRDNIRGIDSLNYYRVARGAFFEDAKIYVDRTYEFNGISPAGLPSYLLGGDYLMTFNEDKQRALKLWVDLSAAVDVYVLFDDRIAVPEWLSRDFQRMPDYIGLDQESSKPLKFEGSMSLATGPGVSVDKKLSVWKRSVDGPGTIVLGAVGATTAISAMYSVVVVPQ